jgi:hypothetical protein
MTSENQSNDPISDIKKQKSRAAERIHHSSAARLSSLSKTRGFPSSPHEEFGFIERKPY